MSPQIVRMAKCHEKEAFNHQLTKSNQGISVPTRRSSTGGSRHEHAELLCNNIVVSCTTNVERRLELSEP